MLVSDADFAIGLRTRQAKLGWQILLGGANRTETCIGV